MDHLNYYKASETDIDILTDIRIKVLIAANKLDSDIDMGLVRNETYQYYMERIKQDTCVIYLALLDDCIVGTGGICFYRVMPTYNNPYGKKAYIMNMYTEPEYRKKGIALRMLEYLVEEAKKKHAMEITLEATDMGKNLYTKYGFDIMENEMRLLLS